MAREPISPQPRPAVFDYRPPLVLRLIKGSLMSLIVTAMVCVAYTVYWFYVASTFRDGLPAWIEQMAGPGATLTYRQLEIAGYPFQFRLILTEPLLDAPALPAWGDKPVTWKASRIVAMMAPWNWDRFTLDLAGSHELDLPAEHGRQHLFARAQSFKTDTELNDDGRPETLDVHVATLRIQESAGASEPQWAAARGEAHARRLFPKDDPIDKPTFELKWQLHDVRLPPGDLPLGRDVARFAGEMRILGKLADPTSTEELAKWRDAGGTVEFSVAESKYGPLSMTANGTAAFDAALQPMAAMTANVQGLFATIDALRARDIVRSRDAAMAKVVLGVMSRPGENGQPTISLPFTIQDGKLSAAMLHLMDVPPIKWPEKKNERPRFIR
jgi:hypothetical protein